MRDTIIISFRTVSRELARHAHLFYGRGWMPGTSGNLSMKVSTHPLRLAITPTSVDKGEMAPNDMLLVDARGRVLRGRGRPSSETTIHIALYDSFPQCGAVFHVHTVHSTLMATHGAAFGSVRAPELGKLASFQTLAPLHHGVTGRHHGIPVLPQMDDRQVFRRLAARRARQLAAVGGFLIAHHGMTCWGRDPSEAKKRLEQMECLSRYLWESRHSTR